MSIRGWHRPANGMSRPATPSCRRGGRHRDDPARRAAALSAAPTENFVVPGFIAWGDPEKAA